MSALEVISAFEYGQERDGLFAVRHTPENNAVCIGYGDGSIDVVSIQTKEVLKSMAPNLRSSMAIISVRFSSKVHQTCFAASSEGKIIMFNYNTGASEIVVVEKENEITCMDFSTDGSMFSTAGRDLIIRTYDAATFQPIREYQPSSEQNLEAGKHGHWNKVFSLKFHPRQTNIFCTGGWDKRIKVWDIRTKTGVTNTISGPHICGDGIDIYDKYLLTASWTLKDALQLWDFSAGQLIKTIQFAQKTERKPTEFLYCAQFIDAEKVIAGGSGSNSARLIDVNTNQMLGEVKLIHPVQSLDTWNKGKTVAVGGGGTTLYVAKVEND